MSHHEHAIDVYTTEKIQLEEKLAQTELDRIQERYDQQVRELREIDLMKTELRKRAFIRIEHDHKNQIFVMYAQISPVRSDKKLFRNEVEPYNISQLITRRIQITRDLEGWGFTNIVDMTGNTLKHWEEYNMSKYGTLYPKKRG